MFACFNYTLLLASKDLHRGFIDIRSYISAHVLLNLLNELGKRDKMRDLPRISSFFATSFINSFIQKARMFDSIYHITLR